MNKKEVPFERLFTVIFSKFTPPSANFEGLTSKITSIMTPTMPKNTK
jgi:hypothetical protein